MLRLGNILVVENDDPIRDLLAEALAMEGYGVQSVSDRTALHAAFAAQSPDLLIYDADLDRGSERPIMDDVRAYDRVVPVLLLTTNVWTARSLARQNLAFCLLKPFQLDDLFACVAQLIDPAGPGADTPVRAQEVGAVLGRA